MQYAGSSGPAPPSGGWAVGPPSTSSTRRTVHGASSVPIPGWPVRTEAVVSSVTGAPSSSSRASRAVGSDGSSGR